MTGHFIQSMTLPPCFISDERIVSTLAGNDDDGVDEELVQKEMPAVGDG